MRRFFVESFDPDGLTAVISGPDARHIKIVLRLKPGDQIELFDGTGIFYSARIHSILPGQVKVDLLDPFSLTTESPVHITVAQAYLKENKMDTLVRQLTELGIHAWIPFISERSIPQPDHKRFEGRRRRWQKIARESLKQCRRGCIPQIGSMETFKAILEMSQSSDVKIIFWESADQPLRSLVVPPQPVRIVRSLFLILGPEGGFSRQEVEQALACGFQSISLGPRILKAETAAVTACALIQYLFGDLS